MLLTKSEVERLLIENNFNSRAALIENIQLSYRLTTVTDSNKLGVTKFGGYPDLPLGLDWPYYNGSPMSFICQINLSDLPFSRCKIDIPSSGMLYFYFDSTQHAYGCDPENKAANKVIYIDGNINKFQERIVHFSEEKIIFKQCIIDPVPEMTILPWESVLLRQNPLSKEERIQYGKLIDNIADLQVPTQNDILHRFLGNPDPMQDDPFECCQLASGGINCSYQVCYHSNNVRSMLNNVDRWTLLLQVDSDPDIDFLWADKGRLYFCIDKNDLFNANFDNVWTIMQW